MWRLHGPWPSKAIFHTLNKEYVDHFGYFRGLNMSLFLHFQAPEKGAFLEFSGS